MADTRRPTIALDSLGCKLNQAEIQEMERRLIKAGYRTVAPSAKADIYVLNTCTVTHIADRKSRHWFRLARRRNPEARLVAIGCYVERAPGDLERLDGLDLVLSNDRKWELPSLLNSFVPPKETSIGSEIIHRTRAFLRVQSGCRNFCSYCIVPLVRSEVAGVPAGQVVAQVKELTDAGHHEIVLTGTEIGNYSCDGVDLAGLLRRILDETDISRLRLSSLQPPEVTPGLIEKWRDPRLCPHFHLSLQSGSDSVLKRMNRRYTVADFQRAVGIIREAVPDVAITTDIIVGFPGESGKEFRESVERCRGMGFARVHVFPYSPRPGTAAADMLGKIPDKVKKERSREMLELAEAGAAAFREKYLGQTLNVLFERSSAGLWNGLTGNYIRVYVKSGNDLTGKITPVKLTKLYRDGVWGEIV